MNRNDADRRANRRPATALLVLLALATATTVQARSDDRDQPMDVNADRMDGALVDDGTVTIERNVRITQGSLDIRSDAAEITLRGGEIVRVVLTGSPAVLRQVDDAGQPMQARANRIDYALSSSQVLLTGAVLIDQPRGTLSGERIFYDLDSGRINAGDEDGGRVRMVIQPRRGGG